VELVGGVFVGPNTPENDFVFEINLPLLSLGLLLLMCIRKENTTKIHKKQPDFGATPP